MDLKELKRKKEATEKELVEVFRKIEETGAKIDYIEIIRTYVDKKIKKVKVHIILNSNW